MRIDSIIILLVFSISQCLKGQLFVDVPDFSHRPETLQMVFDMQFPDQHLKKISGQQYVNPYPSILEHQFFKSKTPFEGIVFTMEDTIYCSHLLYDIYRDKLIAYQKTLHVFIEMEDEFIRRFKLFEKNAEGEYEFLKVELGNDILGIRRTGFLQVLFESEQLDLLRKNYKAYTEYLDNKKYQVRFSMHEKIIMRKDNRYFPVRNKRNILKQYPEAETELKRYFRRSRIRINRASDRQLYEMAIFLDSLQLESVQSTTE